MNRRQTLAAFIALSAGTPWAQKGPVRGAGASFPAGIYSAWCFNFSKLKGTPLEYEAVGSSEGVRRIIARSIDFGATDTPLSLAEQDKNGLVQFPTLVGGIAPVVNLPGVDTRELRLTPAVLARVFLGRIQRWSDPEIAALNKGLALPNRRIARVVREDGSGTTASFTRYLSMTGGDWPGSVGHGSTVAWPGTVAAAKGNGGVVEMLKQTEGGIAYVSSNSLRPNKLAAVQLLNRSGSYVSPAEQNLQAAVTASGMSRSVDDAPNLLDQPGPQSWPITEATYILVERKPQDPERVRKVLSLFYWAFSQGDQMASDTGFVPLPLNVQSRVISKFRNITTPSGESLNFMA
jgi:phosphate transport system substrate-binding protein